MVRLRSVEERLFARPMHSRRSMVKAALVVLLAVGLLAALAVLQILHDGQQRAGYQDALERSVFERTQVRQVFSLLQDAESAQQDFVFTGDADLLEPFERAVENIPARLDAITASTREGPLEQQALQLSDLVSARLAELASGVEARQDFGMGAFDPERTRDSHEAVAAIRELAEHMIETETRAIHALQVAARRQADTFQAIAISLLGAILVLVMAASLLGITYLETRRRAEQDLRHAKQQAEQASEAKTEFLASMSHEIRTPLSGILGYTELLLGDGLNSQQRRYAERIQVAGASLLTVVNDILDFSRIEAGEVKLEPHPFSLPTLIDNIVSILSTVAAKKGLTIRTQVDPRVPTSIVGDEARLRQVLLNLMNNAVKFTDQGSVTLEVHVEELTAADAKIRFAVTDTGIGIPQDKMQLLFTRFSQTDSSIAQRYGGTGLGLAISKQLIDLMGGDIGADSEDAMGSTFWFVVTLGRSKTAESRAAEEAEMRPWPRGRILLVEDLEQNQELAKAMLESCGHSVDVAGGGREAVAAVQRKDYDLVLMDIQMPDMDGLTATRRIRELPPPAGQVPIIALTANVLPQQIQAFRAAGMNDHIGKPFRQAQLQEKAGRWLAAYAGAQHGEKGLLQAADGEALDELRRLMGRDWVVKGLENLRISLEKIPDPRGAQPDRQTVARFAHELVSLSATLGFFRLSRRCSELEEVARTSHDIGAALAAVSAAASEAQKKIDQLLSQERVETSEAT